ncbi:hypothetical protein KSP39_PZI024177 [Platanthera zijinensis]|uniref:Uncharacterized protein n=1 Tax=Platanthera zijinensis TaxID=2320716 RepID=A0AAP0FRZ3_9ASPA
MSEDQWKGRSGESGDPHHQHYHHEHHQPIPQYGTFPDVSSQPPAMGFPQPVPPPGASGYPTHPGPTYYPSGYHSAPGKLFTSCIGNLRSLSSSCDLPHFFSWIDT